MPSPSTSRIARNTLLLYFRMLLTMAVSLYTSRVILNALGVEDYGIYNVVGGVDKEDVKKRFGGTEKHL